MNLPMETFKIICFEQICKWEKNWAKNTNPSFFIEEKRTHLNIKFWSVLKHLGLLYSTPYMGI